MYKVTFIKVPFCAKYFSHEISESRRQNFENSAAIKVLLIMLAVAVTIEHSAQPIQSLELNKKMLVVHACFICVHVS